jgi:predicted transposase YbfD/YdcC
MTLSQNSCESASFNDNKLFKHLEKLEDPRTGWTLTHEFIDIIIIAILAVLSGAEGWNDIEAYGEAKEEWLKGFLKLPHGIPSHDTFNKVIRCIDPEQFAKCFQDWITAAIVLMGAEVIPIDGKVHRGSSDRGKNLKALHTVSAWASSHGVVLAQVAVDKKSNEITAIPKLLEMMDIRGAIITIDAMGCQKSIAEKIVEQGADYVLALKGNQKNLLKAVEQAFEEALSDEKQSNEESFESLEKGHHRFESRKYSVLPAASIDLAWPSTQTIVKVESIREDHCKTTVTTKYYISSMMPRAEEISKAIRSHWSIENQLHWYLDVTFGEDDSRIRKDNGAANFGTLRRLALGLLKREKSLKKSIRLKRYRAAMDNEYLIKVLVA